MFAIAIVLSALITAALVVGGSVAVPIE